MEEYLTVKELSARIKFSNQSLYNLIYKGTFVLGKHYLKPTPKKILFIWSEILGWMEKNSCKNIEASNEIDTNDQVAEQAEKTAQERPISSINI